MMPNQTLPPFLMTSDPGSFARSTILERKPQIIRQVIADNAYPPEIVAALEAFRDEIASQTMQPLRETVSDVNFWNDELAAYPGKTWLEVPWYFAETYFYRKLLEATRYFQPGEWQGHSPFLCQQQKQMEMDGKRLATEWEQLANLAPETRFEALLHSCLWGNRADLSNFTVKVKARGGLAAHQERHLILIDHTNAVQAILSSGVKRADFICDNVGSDLLFDLALVDFLLRQGWVREIHLQLKNQPFFVSDAMPVDAQQTVELLKASAGTTMRASGMRLAEDLAVGRLILDTDPFWTTFLMFRQMPAHLLDELAHSALVLIKGDVNYRRLLDDRRWPYTARMGEIAAYFPASFVVLRTLKGEILVGLSDGQAEAIQAEDSTWLINGKRGVIELVKGKGQTI